MRRSPLLFSPLFAVLLANAAAAQTQTGFALDRFLPAPAGDRFFGVQGGDAGGHGDLRLMVLGEYAWRPLVVYAPGGDQRLGDVVAHQLFIHPAVSVSFWDRLSLSVDVPIAVLTHGNSPIINNVQFSSPSGQALGDIRGGLRLRIVGGAHDAF